MPTESEKRLRRCCFTGHRPEKLHRAESEICEALEGEIKNAISDGFNIFITGMACGVDIWAGEIVLRLRKEGLPIKLICASPFDGFERRWQKDWQDRYNRLMKEADLFRFISLGYHRGCFQVRNEWMVNHSARVIAVYDGTPGGTRNTIYYSQKVGVPVVVVKG